MESNRETMINKKIEADSTKQMYQIKTFIREF